MKKRQIIQPIILWIERPTGAVMGAGSVWPKKIPKGKEKLCHSHSRSLPPSLFSLPLPLLFCRKNRSEEEEEEDSRIW
jgi:hypothetical protein